MKRYYFDIRDGDKLAPDEQGMDLPHVEVAQEEAARSLADMIRDNISGQRLRHVAIEVRDQNGPVFEAKFVWDVQHTMH